MTKKFVKLLELREDDAFHHSHNTYFDYSLLIGRIFEVIDEDGDTPWLGFSGNLVGETMGEWDDGEYIFAYAKVEEVPEPL